MAGIALVVCIVYVVSAVKRTNASFGFFQTVQLELRSGQFDRVEQRFKDADGSELDFGDGNIRFGGRDITGELKVVPMNYWRILEYYLTDPMRHRSEKVIFVPVWAKQPDGAMVPFHGYVLHDGEHITSVKIY